MRTKKVKVGVKKLWDLLEDFAESGKAIEKGKKKIPKRGLF